MSLYINSNYRVLNNEYSLRILSVVKLPVLTVTFTAHSLVHHLLDVQSGRNWPKGGQQKGKRKERSVRTTQTTFYNQLQALASKRNACANDQM